MGNITPAGAGLDYTINSADPDCAFTGVGDHALRSKEHANEAFVEGFAQYLSTLAYNNHAETIAWFKYYKNIAAGDVDGPAYADLRNDNWKVAVEDSIVGDWGGPSNWLETMCSWNDGHSVEMDWQRFYWDYRTNSGTKPTHSQIFGHLKTTFDLFGWTSTTAWDMFKLHLTDAGQGAFQSRWDSLSLSNGIDQ